MCFLCIVTHSLWLLLPHKSNWTLFPRKCIQQAVLLTVFSANKNSNANFTFMQLTTVKYYLCSALVKAPACFSSFKIIFCALWVLWSMQLYFLYWNSKHKQSWGFLLRETYRKISSILTSHTFLQIKRIFPLTLLTSYTFLQNKRVFSLNLLD